MFNNFRPLGIFFQKEAIMVRVLSIILLKSSHRDTHEKGYTSRVIARPSGSYFAGVLVCHAFDDVAAAKNSEHCI